MTDWCKNCAIRLFNTKHHNLQGIGNPWSNKCIVVPNVDYDAYKYGDMSFSKQVRIIKDILPFLTGGLDSNLYLIPMIRCNETISCELDKESYKKCLNYFAQDLKIYNFQNILLLGDAARRFLNIDIGNNLNSLFLSARRRYFVNYSPLIQYVDQNKFEIFKQGLINWYNNVINDDFKSYNIMRL